jgi:hypothetical protein
MPQFVEFLPVGPDLRAAISALVKVCKETPGPGEPFRDFRARLRAGKLWDRERPQAALRFLAVGGAMVVPSEFMSALARASGDDATIKVIVDRLWGVNPLLAKTILDLLGERAYGKDELYKYLGSAAYRGVLPSRPGLESWLQLALALGLIKPVGIAVARGPRAEMLLDRASAFEVDEFLAEDKAEPEPVIPGEGDDDPAAPAVEAVYSPETSIPVAAAAPAGMPLPIALRHLASPLKNPRGRERAVAVSRFSAGFDPSVLAETQRRIAGWWAENRREPQRFSPADFGVDSETWVERADEALYRLAVAAALVFRLESDRAGVVHAFAALDGAGVLSDLYHGTVPETLSAQVDARALMLASLAARRCAESPDLAATIDQQASAAGIFAALDGALGRGLFRIELLWIMDMLGRLGVVRHADLAEFTAIPYRLVRDTLFRLGFLETPYAADATSLAQAAKAARGIDPAGPAEEILAAFALAAGCAYDCPHRRSCDFPCRERLE